MELHVKEFPGIYDVAVVGGGVSGCHAALAAARLGAKVLLIEACGSLGGALVNMGVGPMMSFHNRAGRQLICGTPQEMVDRLIARHGSPGHILDSTGYCSTVTPFDAEILKVVLDGMLAESGVDVLFHTRLVEAVCPADTVDSLVVHNRGGLQRVRASVYVDATGDAELAHLCGVPFTLGREGDNRTQPLTMNVRVAGVDSRALKCHILTHWDQFTDEVRADGGPKMLERAPRISMWGFYDAWRQAKARGDVDIPRDNVLFFETNTVGEFIFNTSRILGVDPTDPIAVGRAETEGRRQAQELFRFLRNGIPGFENAVLIGTPGHVGIRESRHPRAVYMLTAEDLLSERRFVHTVALGGYPIDIHSPDGQGTHSRHLSEKGCYCIPMESLMANEHSNLLLTGRAIGADHYAGAAVRVTPIAMATGQAAGTMAFLARETGVGGIGYDDLKKRLMAANVLLEPDSNI